MKLKLVASVVVVIAFLAGCATPGTPVDDFGAAFGEYDGTPVMIDGEMGRNIQVTGTSVYLSLLGGEGSRVPMLSAAPYAYGTDVTVLARAYAYDGAPYDEMDESVKSAISEFAASVEAGDEEQIEFQTRNIAQFLKTFAIGSGSDYFLIEVMAEQM